MKGPEDSKAGAAAYEAVLRQKLARGESIEPVAQEEELTFEQFAWKWFDDYVKSNNKPSEQAGKRCILSATLIPFFGAMPIGEIGTHDVERFKARQFQRGRTNKTILNQLTVLHKCLVTAYEWLQLEGSPPKIKWPKCATPEIDYLSPEECELLLRHAKGIVHEMVLLALRTGMRQGEIRGLQWSSVDWLNRSITVRHSLDNHSRTLVAPKSGRTRHIPMDVDVYEMLYRRKRETGYVFLADEGRPFSNYRVHYAITHLCRRAGLRKIGWHTLRHTFASHLAMRGAPLNAVQSLLGHSTITMTMRYAHVAPSTLKSAIDLLNPKNIVNADFGHPMGTEWVEAQRKESAQK